MDTGDDVMLIDIAVLPPSVQEQIMAVAHGETVQFAKDGKVVASLTNDETQAKQTTSKLIGDDVAFGMFAWHGIDGLEYERQIRSEWD